MARTPIRSRYSKLSSFKYTMDIHPQCNNEIKALRTKNYGSIPDPDPASLLKLRFRQKSIRGRDTPTTPGSPIRDKSRTLKAITVRQNELM